MFSPALSKKQRSGPGGSADGDGEDGNSQSLEQTLLCPGSSGSAEPRGLKPGIAWSKHFPKAMTKISMICADSNHLMGTLASGWAGEGLCPPIPPCTCWFGRGGQLTESCGTALGTYLFLCTASGVVASCPASAGKPGWEGRMQVVLPSTLQDHGLGAVLGWDSAFFMFKPLAAGAHVLAF